MPFMLLVLLGVGWGGSFALIKAATSAGAAPLGVALWGALGSGLVVLASMLAIERPLPLARRHLVFYAVSGIVGVALPDAAIYFAARRLPVGVLTLLVTLAPILTYGLSLAAAVERLAWLRVAGILAGACGIALMVLPEASLPEPGLRGWVLLAALGTLGYAIQNVYIAGWAPAGSDAMGQACGSLVLGGLALLPLVLATDAWVALSPPWGTGEWQVVGIVAVNAACMGLFFALIRSNGPVFASQVAYVVTIAGLLWGAVFFAERPSVWVWAAVASMFAGIALVGGRHPRARR